MIYVRLNEYLKDNGNEMSLRKLAEDVGLTREQVRRFAANEMKEIPIGMLDKLCDYFGCDVGDLVEHQKNQ